MKHRWALAMGIAVIAAAGISARGQVVEKPGKLEAPIELEISAGTDVSIEGSALNHDADSRELTVTAPATLRLGKAMILRSRRQAVVVYPKAGTRGSTLLRIGGTE
jgi:hypothetical protein